MEIDMKNIFIIGFIGLLLNGCSSSKIELPEQKVTANINKETLINQTFTNKSDQRVYIYVLGKSISVETSNAKELPTNYKVLLQSLLADFKNVTVIMDEAQYNKNLEDKKLRENTYILSGAITQFDKDILSTSDTFQVSVNFGGGEGETDINKDYTDSTSKSILAVDLILSHKHRGLVYKSSSKIDINTKNESNNFALMLNGGQIGYRSYINIKNGVDESIRKIFSASIRDIISQLIRNRSTL
jgi:hypothetical protein